MIVWFGLKKYTFQLFGSSHESNTSPKTMSKLRTDYQNVIDELDEAINNDQPYLSRDLLEHLQPVAQKNSLVKAFFSDNAERLEKLREDIGRVDELLHSLNSDEGWKEASKSSRVTVHFQKPEGSPFLMTKAETLFETNLADLPDMFVKVMSLFNENDLMPKWFPMGVMKGNECIHQESKFVKVIQPLIKLPFPISGVIGPRETLVVGRGYDMSERKAVAIAVNPMEAGETLGSFTAPEVPKGFTRITMIGAYYFELTPKGIVFKLLQQLDLKSNIIPTPLMNWIAKGAMPNEFISQIRSRVKKYEGSKWEERVLANPKFYDEIKQRLTATLEKEYGMSTIALAKEEAESAALARKNSKRSLRRSMSKLSKRISRTASMPFGKKKTQSEPVPEPIPEPEPEPEPVEKGAADFAMDGAMAVIDAVSAVVDLGRKAAITVAPSLKEKYPIMFKDLEELTPSR